MNARDLGRIILLALPGATIGAALVFAFQEPLRTIGVLP